VVDGAVLKLIKQWLEAPVVEEDQNDENRGGKPRPKVMRNIQGTPQGGVISPLLANLYLHWFDRAVYGENGPAKWAKVELVRYADDFVLLCRKITPRLESFVTEKIEQWLGLKINRDKTRIYEVKASESGLDFLGFNFQLAPSPHGPKRRYWRIAPSKKSEQREVARVREMISNKQQHIPVTELIGDINRHLRGWKAYYGEWHCGAAMRKIKWSRGKSGDQAPTETQPAALASSRSNHAGDPSQQSRTGTALRNFTMKTDDESRMRANPHVRFDEGEGDGAQARYAVLRHGRGNLDTRLAVT
jgi:RNA-directed DNA polymerase